MMTTRVSNAAPYLRERFIDKIRNAHAARTQRDRRPHPRRLLPVRLGAEEVAPQEV
jgi:hypothetical protein